MARIPDSPVPVSNDSPPGMQLLFGNRQEPFGAELIADIEYTRYGDRPMHLHLISPFSARLAPHPEGMPLLVFVQGSGWGVQKRYMNIPQLSELAHAGYIVASVEYRPASEAFFPAQVQDVKAAIRFLRKNCREYMIDPERIAIMGDSSGGHTALMVGLSEGEALFDTDDYPDQSSWVSAIVDIYGVTDFPALRRERGDTENVPPEEMIENFVLGPDGIKNPEILKRCNPTYYVTAERPLPPVMILHGDSDPVVPFSQSTLMYTQLQAHNRTAFLYKVVGGMHGTRFWSRELFDTIRQFLDVYL